MTNNLPGKSRPMPTPQMSDFDDSKSLRGLSIALLISMLFWAVLAFFLL
jgi:hypothetical protein